MENNELNHHGIVGMKWGVRRYQNRDGSFTPAGKKRYEKELAKLKEKEKRIKAAERTKASIDKLDAKRKELKEREQALKGEEPKKKEFSLFKKKASDKPKSVKDMSDQELQAVVNRLNLESRYNQLNPKKVSLGERFVKKTMSAVVAPAAIEVGKSILKTALEKATGVKTEKKNEKKSGDT